MLDQAFQALADPTRRAVVERLCDGPASVSELAQPFSMTLAAVVQHVQVLEAAGLRAAEAWLTARRTRVERQLDRLAALVERTPEPSTPEEE